MTTVEAALLLSIRRADALVAWNAARQEALRLRDERGAIDCIHEVNTETSPGVFETPPPCWKRFEWVRDGEDMKRTDTATWCEHCRRRQALHERYLAAVRRRGALLRVMQKVADLASGPGRG